MQLPSIQARCTNRRENTLTRTIDDILLPRKNPNNPEIEVVIPDTNRTLRPSPAYSQPSPPSGPCPQLCERHAGPTRSRLTQWSFRVPTQQPDQLRRHERARTGPEPSTEAATRCFGLRTMQAEEVEVITRPLRMVSIDEPGLIGYAF